MPLLDDREFEKQSNFETYKRLEREREEKVEFGNGHILMSSSTSIIHNLLIKRISRNLDKYLNPKGCDSFTESIEIILDRDEKIYRFKPDIFVFCKDQLNMVGQSIKGTPPLIFEVVSKSNDTVYKRKYYADCGVLEYCLVYQDGSIEQLRLEDGMYRVINILKKDDIYNSIAFPGVNFKLKDIFSELEIYR
ncbi:Uma2 family endonuclease [Clostridium massiliamazoniense]|uniref:Uma2 family endonuclease n=1 Tax=Clostridium massiliamazoniense TaxID=1347366 RepID=UPI0006D782CE|nr:Uma2 family endonuclease [Clostridium massiliamazoniense]